jgi:hypothetical protein
MTRPGVLLYEPRHGSTRLPLSLLHVASALDARVAIVDGRLEMAPAALVSELAKDAICLGVTTPTGPALADALEVSRAAKSARKQLPVLWGGPHATFRAAECLATGVVDACVMGPGERTLAEVVAALQAGGADVGIPGLAFIRDDEVAQSLPRAPEDLNHLPHADYGLVDLERHFRYRGVRRVEVSTSRGGGRGEVWSGLLAERVIAIVEDLALRHRATEVVFVDQGFFADTERVQSIAAGLLKLQAHFVWDASGNLPDLRKALLKLDWPVLKQSGGRLVTVWVEGPPEPGLFEVAQTLVRAGFEVRARFVVGRPGEDSLSPSEAYRAARGLLGLSPALAVELRLFEPWPGCSEAEGLLAKTPGPTPAGVSSWAKFEPDAFASTWLPASVRRSVPRWSFYLTQAARRPPRRLSQRLLRRLARGRARVGFYGLDFERRAILLLQRLKTALSLRTAAPSDD